MHQGPGICEWHRAERMIGTCLGPAAADAGRERHGDEARLCAMRSGFLECCTASDRRRLTRLLGGAMSRPAAADRIGAVAMTKTEVVLGALEALATLAIRKSGPAARRYRRTTPTG